MSTGNPTFNSPMNKGESQKLEERKSIQERDILLKSLANQEEKRRRFNEAGLTPEEQAAYEEYLKDVEELKARMGTTWGAIKTRLNPLALESVPNYTPEKKKLITSAENKLLNIERGKKGYNI